MPVLVDELKAAEQSNAFLETPCGWAAGKEGCVQVTKETPEWNQVSKYLKTSLERGAGDRIKLKHLNIERVQSRALWRIYAAKRQEVMLRFAEYQLADYPGELPNNKGWPEEQWLFHGTTANSVSQIAKRGFDRSFAGKNGTMYGKGSYFARNASYASRYAATEKKEGIRYMFMCRMVVGDWCQGSKDHLRPDCKRDGELYDSTVDNVENPTIFVAYHDAQVYPDYLVSFQY
jgi:poly [ADP-ribose] polymerase 10/14/15